MAADAAFEGALTKVSELFDRLKACGTTSSTGSTGC